jgi:hypothetical protein
MVPQTYLADKVLFSFVKPLLEIFVILTSFYKA